MTDRVGELDAREIAIFDRAWGEAVADGHLPGTALYMRLLNEWSRMEIRASPELFLRWAAGSSEALESR